MPLMFSSPLLAVGLMRTSSTTLFCGSANRSPSNSTMSAETIGDLWTLRCAVREHMLGWLKTNQPEALIRHRPEVEAANARAADGG